MSTRISLRLSVDAPETVSTPPIERPEEKISRALELIDSGHESRAEWKYIRWINNSLTRKYQEGRICDRELAVLKMIQPIIEKYGMFDPEGVEQDASLHTSTGESE